MEFDRFIPKVFRFNRAPLIGYEDHVGTKTNFRILNNHVFENINPERI